MLKDVLNKLYEAEEVILMAKNSAANGEHLATLKDIALAITKLSSAMELLF